LVLSGEGCDALVGGAAQLVRIAASGVWLNASSHSRVTRPWLGTAGR